MVTIRCIAYNQAEYIRQCLDGFVMQKTDFRFEAVVHDDASTDGTDEIIREYAEKYPDIIKPIFEKENLYSKHDGSLFRVMKEACKGKYIAYCEGDDYWTDPCKLQKQVDYLESHPDVVYSCHRFTRHLQSSGIDKKGRGKYFDRFWNKGRTEFLFGWKYPFTNAWITQTLTQVIRRDAIDNDYLSRFRYNRDVHLVYSVLSKGKGVCHNFNGGVYRINDKGIYRGKSKEERRQISYDIYKELYEKTGEPLFGRLCRKNARRLYFQRLWVHR